MAEIFVCRSGDIAEGGARIIRSGEVEIGVLRHRGKYYAYRNHCPHQGGPVCEGARMPKVVEIISADRRYQGQAYDEAEMHIVCPWHSYEFNIETGAHAIDSKIRLQKFNVIERNGEIYVAA
jgi:nitrite reductase/ring-hydroxylating ferredoxin subunit